jgi:putative salt-induced outer membrane protein YdiY
MNQISRTLGISLLLFTATHGIASAQDEEETQRAWSNVADLSLVATAGNSEVMSWALSDKFTYNWTNQRLTLEAQGLRTSTTVRNLTNDAGTVQVDEVSETTAEQYFVGGRFRQRIYLRLFAYTNASWFRNELAGVQNRAQAALGLGYTFFESEKSFLTGELGGSWTDEEQITTLSNNWVGAQAIFDFMYKLTETASFDWDLAILPNLEDSEDLRVNTVAGLTSAISSVFALKVSYTLLFDNKPVQVVVPGATPADDALFTFDKYDHRLAASLVMNL